MMQNHKNPQHQLPRNRPKRLRLTFVVSGDEAKDVFVPQHDSLVELGLTEPTSFFARGEDFDGHVLPAPTPAPHRPETTLPDALLVRNGFV